MRYVRLTKLSGSNNTRFPIGFWIEGPMHREPKVGEEVVLFDNADNGMSNSESYFYQWFHTSTVDKIEGDVIETANSRYRITTLK